MNVLCVIPARYASTRLPGKPLLDIAGKPMIEHVYQRACQASRPSAVVVATDHEAVYRTVLGFGGRAMMTSPDHATGTDRLAEVAASYAAADVIVNVQGDEPLIRPDIIDALADVFEDQPQLNMATVMTAMDPAEYDNPNAVKVVADRAGFALYFSRSLIPYPRAAGAAVYQHLGIYAYRRQFLLEYAQLPPTPLEQSESLEQLRALEHGHRIKIITTDFMSVGVDTPDDLERVNRLLAAQQNQI